MKTGKQLLAEQLIKEEYNPRGCKGLAIIISLVGAGITSGIIYGIIELVKAIK